MHLLVLAGTSSIGRAGQHWPKQVQPGKLSRAAQSRVGRDSTQVQHSMVRQGWVGTGTAWLYSLSSCQLKDDCQKLSAQHTVLRGALPARALRTLQIL